jgi:hypothetical protein
MIGNSNNEYCETAERDSSIDVCAAGDLSNWEYLTRTYDQEIFQEELAQSYQMVPMERTMPHDLFYQSSSGHHDFSRPHHYELLQVANGQGTSNASARVFVDKSTNAVFLSRKQLTFTAQGHSQPINTCVVPCQLNSHQARQHEPFVSQWNAVDGDKCGLDRLYLGDSAVITDDELAQLETLRLTHPIRSPTDLGRLDISAATWEPTEVGEATLTCTAPVADEGASWKRRRTSPGPPSGTSNRITHVAPSIEINAASSQSSSLPDLSQLEKMCLPLSAYNYFYRDESENIVQGMNSAHDPLPSPISDFTPERQEKLLHQHWYGCISAGLPWVQPNESAHRCSIVDRFFRYVDPFKKRRPHRKTHGRIDFET